MRSGFMAWLGGYRGVYRPGNQEAVGEYIAVWIRGRGMLLIEMTAKS